MQAYGINNLHEFYNNMNWMVVAKPSLGSLPGKNGVDIRSPKKNTVVKNQLRRSIRKSGRQKAKAKLYNEMAYL